MKNVSLIDSGPIIALFNKKDRYHKKCLNFFKSYRGSLISSCSVVTEVIYLLSFSITAQMNFLEWIERGGLTIHELSADDLDYIKKRMKKYSDLPMDFANASLMSFSEKFSIDAIISIDSDFSIYRKLDGKFLKNLL